MTPEVLEASEKLAAPLGAAWGAAKALGGKVLGGLATKFPGIAGAVKKIAPVAAFGAGYAGIPTGGKANMAGFMTGMAKDTVSSTIHNQPGMFHSGITSTASLRLPWLKEAGLDAKDILHTSSWTKEAGLDAKDILHAAPYAVFAARHLLPIPQDSWIGPAMDIGALAGLGAMDVHDILDPGKRSLPSALDLGGLALMTGSTIDDFLRPSPVPH